MVDFGDSCALSAATTKAKRLSLAGGGHSHWDDRGGKHGGASDGCPKSTRTAGGEHDGHLSRNGRGNKHNVNHNDNVNDHTQWWEIPEDNNNGWDDHGWEGDDNGWRERRKARDRERRRQRRRREARDRTTGAIETAYDGRRGGDLHHRGNFPAGNDDLKRRNNFNMGEMQMIPKSSGAGNASSLGKNAAKDNGRGQLSRDHPYNGSSSSQRQNPNNGRIIKSHEQLVSSGRDNGRSDKRQRKRARDRERRKGNFLPNSASRNCADIIAAVGGGVKSVRQFFGAAISGEGALSSADAAKASVGSRTGQSSTKADLKSDRATKSSSQAAHAKEGAYNDHANGTNNAVRAADTTSPENGWNGGGGDWNARSENADGWTNDWGASSKDGERDDRRRLKRNRGGRRAGRTTGGRPP